MSSSNPVTELDQPTQVKEIKPTQRFISHCRVLADDFVSSNRYRLSRILPLSLVVAGVISAFSLVYVRLSWFFFGPSLAIGFLLISAVMGDESEDGGPVRMRLWKWVVKWPWWEYAVAALCGVLFLAAAIWGEFWQSVLMGGACGVGLGMIFYVAVTLPLKELRAPISKAFRQIVGTLQRYGISQLEVEMGSPKLLGPSWMPLFETTFGYEAYRSISEQVKANEPELMRNRRKIRDFVCDFLMYGIQHNAGPVGTVAAFRRKQLSVAKDKESLKRMSQVNQPHRIEGGLKASVDDTVAGSELSSIDPFVGDDESYNVASQYAGGSQSGDARYDGAHAHAGSGPIYATVHDLDSLKADQLSIYVTNAQLDRLLDQSDVKATTEGRPRRTTQVYVDGLSIEERKRYRKIDRFLGDEARLSAAFIVFGIFGFWVYQSGLAGDASVEAIQTAITSVRVFGTDDIRRSINGLGDALTFCNQELVPLGLSGWSFLMVSVILFLSSIKHGWQYSLFVLVASVVLMVGMSASLVWGSSRDVGWACFASAIVLLVLGLLWEQTKWGRQFAIYNVRR